MSETLCPVLPLLRSRLGVSPSPATLWRWTRRGVGGVTLRTVRVGKRLFSSERWVAEFIAKQQQATASPEPTSPRTSDESAALRAAGLLGD
ncbi:MAG: DUF1580 domain-containing protein [Planctomycetaceae bacterium]